jgi:hypothetical protein
VGNVTPRRPLAMRATASTVQRARELFARQHNGADPRHDWPRPDPATQFLASCEWRLWEAYKRHRLDYLQGNGPDPDKNGATDWLLGFYIKLATSPDIKRVCGAQCRSSKYADALLGLLFRESDMMTWANRPADRPVFGELMGKQIARTRAQQERTEHPQAKADLRQFAIMYDAVESLSPAIAEFEREELRTVIARLARPAALTAHPPPAPTSITVGGTVYPLPQPAPSPPGHAGRPAFDNGSEDTYCELVERLVKKAYRGRDELEKAVALIQHFSPGLLGNDSYTANQLGSRLKPFREKPNVRQYLARLEAVFVQNMPLTRMPL